MKKGKELSREKLLSLYFWVILHHMTNSFMVYTSGLDTKVKPFATPLINLIKQTSAHAGKLLLLLILF